LFFYANVPLCEDNIKIRHFGFKSFCAFLKKEWFCMKNLKLSAFQMKKQWGPIIFRLLSVPVTALAIAIVYYFKIPNPMMILIIPVVLFTYLDGYISGSLSGFTAVAYAAYFFYIATADVVAGEKLMTIVLAVASIIIMVGKLKARDKSTIAILKQTQDELVKKKDYAEELSQAKSEFISSMSHEIRTPINAIIGMTTIGKKATDIEQKNHAINKIGDASSHLLGVINDVLDMAKIEANKLELANIEYNFERMLQKVLTVVGFRLDEKQQRLTVNVSDKIPHFLIGDDQRLAQVITNLLSNAVKFTPENGEIRFDAFFVSETGGNCELRIEVTDSGIGISADQIERLFSAFEQAESGTSRQYGGTGLGLAISKRIVELMGGRIWAESEPGKGSKFIFTFKAQRCDKSLRSMLTPGVNWEDVKILAVDALAETRTQMQTIFGRLGIRCDVAADGNEACRLVEERGGYNIFFIGWRIPGIDEIELTRKIKDSAANNPKVVMIITAMDWKQIKDEASRAGVNKYLLKPLLSPMVVDCVNECLGKPYNTKTNSSVRFGEFAGKKMLLAEDIEINREILIALLEDTGLIIDCAENGEEVLAKIEASPNKYDIVFMDMQLPVMDGLEASRRLRLLPENQRGRLPIIAMTANVFKDDIEKCLAAGMDDHLGKPIDIDKVMDVLRKYLKA
jgi:signal transduction histidine kinase/CheY-like chemotaxis protein